jgi:hypothetical protein
VNWKLILVTYVPQLEYPEPERRTDSVIEIVHDPMISSVP